MKFFLKTFLAVFMLFFIFSNNNVLAQPAENTGTSSIKTITPGENRKTKPPTKKVAPNSAQASSTTTTKGGVKVPTSDDLGGLSDKDIKGTLETVIDTILAIVGTLSLLMIVVGAVIFIVAGDNRDLAETAQSMITYAIVGLVVSLLSYAVVIWVFDALS